MDYNTDYVFVPLETHPQGIWLNGAITEHPSYAYEATKVYAHYPVIENEQCVAIRVKVPRRHTNELRRSLCSEGT